MTNFAERAARIVRSWNPWWLRAEIAQLRRNFADDRNSHLTDEAATVAEQTLRWAGYVLAGYTDPDLEGRRYRVEGTTLVVDATKDRR